MRDNVGLREITPQSAIEFPLSTHCGPWPTAASGHQFSISLLSIARDTVNGLPDIGDVAYVVSPGDQLKPLARVANAVHVNIRPVKTHFNPFSPACGAGYLGNNLRVDAMLLEAPIGFADSLDYFAVIFASAF